MSDEAESKQIRHMRQIGKTRAQTYGLQAQHAEKYGVIPVLEEDLEEAVESQRNELKPMPVVVLDGPSRSAGMTQRLRETIEAELAAMRVGNRAQRRAKMRAARKKGII